MSGCQQAKAARRKAKLDPRYAKRGRRDINVAAQRLKERIAAENIRRQRKATSSKK